VARDAETLHVVDGILSPQMERDDVICFEVCFWVCLAAVLADVVISLEDVDAFSFCVLPTEDAGGVECGPFAFL
jgi:hypothetical protein